MKLKHAIMTFAFTLAAGLGAIGALNLNKKAEAKEASAAASTKLYIDLTKCTGSDDWTTAGAQTYLRVFTNPSTFIKVTDEEQVATNIYVVETDISSGCQLVRIAAGVAKENIVDKSSDQGGSIWTYGSNHSDNNDYCTVSGYSANWSYVGGKSETYETASTTPTSTTKRIWLDPKEHFYDGNARAALRTFSGDTPLKNYILSGSSQYVTVNGETLFYVDIPLNADAQLVRLHNALNLIWTYGANISEISGYDTSKVVYTADAGAYCSAANEATGVTVEYAKLVLDGYSTCENSSVNGYKNIDNLTANVLSHLSASDLSTLRSSSFDAGTYESRTYGDKIDLMNLKDDSTSSNSILPIVNNNNTAATIIIVISTLSITALGLFFFLKKRKESK